MWEITETQRGTVNFFLSPTKMSIYTKQYLKKITKNNKKTTIEITYKNFLGISKK